MRRLIKSALVVATASLWLSSLAGAESLSGDKIKALVSGKKVYLATPYGAELPLRYMRNGSVKGDVSGFSVASMLTPKETGSWWVKGDKLCQKWPTWYKGKTICFTVNQTGPGSISWVRDDGMKGTARIEG